MKNSRPSIWKWLPCVPMLLILSCDSSPAKPRTWVAKVGNHHVTDEEFHAYLDQQCRRNPALRLTPTKNRELLGKYLEKCLLVSEAERLGLNRESEVVQDLREMREQILVKHLFIRKAAEVSGKITVTEEEIKKYYADLGQEIHFHYLPIGDPEQGKEILARWANNQAPAGLVDSGWAKLANLGGPWKEQLRRLDLQKPQIVRIDSQWVLVQVMEKRSAPTLPLDQARSEIIQELADQKKKELLEKWVTELKESAGIEINPAQLGR